MKRYLALAILIAGCTTSAPSKAPVATIAPTPSYPVISRLVGRHQTITISAGPISALYSVQSSDGAILVSYATLDQLRTEHPDQFKFIEPVVAADASIIADVAE